jgi:hypothetical protein
MIIAKKVKLKQAKSFVLFLAMLWPHLARPRILLQSIAFFCIYVRHGEVWLIFSTSLVVFHGGFFWYSALLIILL